MKSPKRLFGFLALFCSFLNASFAQLEQVPLTWAFNNNGYGYVANEYLEIDQNGYVETHFTASSPVYFSIGFNNTNNTADPANDFLYGVLYFNGSWYEYVNGAFNSVIPGAVLQPGDIVWVERTGNIYELLVNGSVLKTTVTTATGRVYPKIYDYYATGQEDHFYFFRESTAEFNPSWMGNIGGYYFMEEYLARGEDGFIELEDDLSHHMDINFHDARNTGWGPRIAKLRYHTNGRIYWWYRYKGQNLGGSTFVGQPIGDVKLRLVRDGASIGFYLGSSELKRIPTDPNIDLFPVLYRYHTSQQAQTKLSFNRKGKSCQNNDYFNVNNASYISDMEDVHYLDPEDETLSWNYTYTRTFDGTGEDKCHVISESRSYFDDLGRAIQSQSKDYLTGKIWAIESLFDDYERGIISTLPAPTFDSRIKFKNNFVLNNSGQAYSSIDFDGANLNTPVAVGKQPGTVGWWYSERNTEEPWQATTDFPYNRTEVSRMTGQPLRSAGAGDKFRMGSGHEVESYTMPAGEEINRFFKSKHPMCRLLQSKSTYPDPYNVLSNQCTGTFEQRYMKTVSVDPDGKEAVVFTDYDGNVVGKAINNNGSGTNINTSFTIEKAPDDGNPNTYYHSYPNNFVDIHIAKDGTNITFENTSPNSSALRYTIRDIRSVEGIPVTNGSQTGVSNFTLNKGFYRVINHREDGDLKLTYNLRYRDHSLYIHNTRGQLLASVAPNDVKTSGNHLAYTYYNYNSSGELVWEDTPDGGKSYFLYRKDGSIRFSVNSKQLTEAKFSYSKYDDIGRIIELGVGELIGDYQNNITAMLNYLKTKVDQNGFPTTSPPGNCTPSPTTPCCTSEETFYEYDVSASNWTNTSYPQLYTAGRLSRTWNDNEQIWFGYDEFGRSTWEAREVTHLTYYPNNPDNPGVKITVYEYDLVGNVTEVIYQGGASDEYRHHYGYDMNGQLRSVGGRGDGDVNTVTDLHAKYTYTPSGKMDKYTIADGLEEQHYVYTLQGQLKAINPVDMLDPDYSSIGYSNTFGMVLSYHRNDYSPANGLWKETYKFPTNSSTSVTYNFFDGKIGGIRWKSRADDVGGTDYSGHKGYQIRYNYRNEMYQSYFANIIPYSNANYAGQVSFRSDYYVLTPSYDKNGNINWMRRNGPDSGICLDGSNPLFMDYLTYNYDKTGGRNQLTHISDAYDNTCNDFGSIKDQSAGNYSYNPIGQMTEDASEDMKIEYDAYGKVKAIYEIINPTTFELKAEYLYGPDGQRIKKINHTATNFLDVTWYARNGSGSVQSIYNWIGSTASGGASSLTNQKEVPIYGGSRIGTAYVNNNLFDYHYELNDHLGNVRAVIKEASTTGAEIVRYADYYPFGWEMPARNGGSNYRYAYQGQFAEKDEETGWNAFELRSYDGRVGRWMSTDPYGQYYSPYLAMGNSPFGAIDADGGFSTWAGAAMYWLFNGGGDIGYSKDKGEYFVGQKVAYTGEGMGTSYKRVFEGNAGLKNWLNKHVEIYGQAAIRTKEEIIKKELNGEKFTTTVVVPWLGAKVSTSNGLEQFTIGSSYISGKLQGTKESAFYHVDLRQYADPESVEGGSKTRILAGVGVPFKKKIKKYTGIEFGYKAEADIGFTLASGMIPHFRDPYVGARGVAGIGISPSKFIPGRVRNAIMRMTGYKIKDFDVEIAAGIKFKFME